MRFGPRSSSAGPEECREGSMLAEHRGGRSRKNSSDKKRKIMRSIVCLILFVLTLPYLLVMAVGPAFGNQSPNARTGFYAFAAGAVTQAPRASKGSEASTASASFANKHSLFDHKHLAQLNRKLANMDALDIIRWAHRTFPNLVQFTSFGPTGMVILDMLHELGILHETLVVTIDTLHLFEETYELQRKVQAHYGDLDLRVYRPAAPYDTLESFTAHYGEKLWEIDAAQYDYVSKVEPTERALTEMGVSVWITGRRRSQGGSRSKLPFLQLKDGRLQLNPLAAWSLEDVWGYIRSKQLPYNALHDQGYQSIGDKHSTQKTPPGAGEREGRWAGQEHSECGMHEHLEKYKKYMNGKEVPSLPCFRCVTVTSSSFMTEVVQAATQKDVLLELYSPWCSHCVAFAPHLANVAERLHTWRHKIRVARMDAVTHTLPPEAQKLGYKVAAFPTMYLINHAQPDNLIEYKGQHTEDALFNWLTQQLSYLQ
eukprot:g4953.t1